MCSLSLASAGFTLLAPYFPSLGQHVGLAHHTVLHQDSSVYFSVSKIGQRNGIPSGELTTILKSSVS